MVSSAEAFLNMQVMVSLQRGLSIKENTSLSTRGNLICKNEGQKGKTNTTKNMEVLWVFFDSFW